MMRWCHRRRRVIQGIGIATLCWAVVAIAALIWSPMWPEARPLFRAIHGEPVVVGHISAFEAWRGQIVNVLASYFLFLKSWLMTRRSRFFDRLGVSIIAVNVMFAVLTEIAVAFAFWPGLQSHRWGREAVNDVFLLVILWGIVELLRTQDGDDQPAAVQP